MWRNSWPPASWAKCKCGVRELGRTGIIYSAVVWTSTLSHGWPHDNREITCSESNKCCKTHWIRTYALTMESLPRFEKLEFSTHNRLSTIKLMNKYYIVVSCLTCSIFNNFYHPIERIPMMFTLHLLVHIGWLKFITYVSGSGSICSFG